MRFRIDAWRPLCNRWRVLMREELPAPPRIADYELLRPIGRGSYGVVWLARSVTGLYRAVKIVWRESFEDPQPYEREFRGIKEFAAISLVAPRQLALLHVGRNDAEGFFYYVMELADDVESGREIDPTDYIPNTLKEVRARRHRLPAAEAIALAVELAEGLAELHQRGLVHRDIKPSNIILVGGAPKLADIGLVASTRNSELTMSRVGNPGYMPPDFPGVPSADVFGLGRVLYELAMGRERDDFPALPDLADIPDRKELLELNEVLLRACAPDPTRRYADASALLDDLRLLQAGKSVRRLRAAERHLSRALRSVAVLAIVATVAGAGAWIAQRRAAQEMRLREKAEAERDTLARRSVYAATLARAQRALETDEPGLARRLLQTLVPKPGDTDLRNFEWGTLWRESQGDPALVAHAGEIIKRIALSPDERLIAGQVGDQRTIVWDAETLREIRRISGTRLIGGFSTDGEWLVGTDRTQGLQRWRVATGEADGPAAAGFNFPALPLGPDRVLGLTNDAGGRAVGLRIWDFSRRREEVALSLIVPDPGNWTYMPHPAVSDDGVHSAVAIRNRRSPETGWRVQVYDVAARRLAYEQVPAARTTALGLSADGSLLGVAAADTGTIQLHDVPGKRLLWEQPARLTFVHTLGFSRDGTRLLVGGDGSALRMFDTTDGRPAGEFRGHDVGVIDVRWTKDGRTFFSADTGGDLRRWPAQAPAAQGTLLRTGYWTGKWIDMMQTRSVCVSPDGRWFAAPESETRLRIAPISGGPTARSVEGSFPLAFTADNTRIAVLTLGGVMREYDVTGEPKLVHEAPLLPAGDSPVNFAALSANRETLVASAQSGWLWVWHFPTRKLVAETDLKQASVWAALSASGQRVALAARDNILRVAGTDRATVLGEAASGGSRRGAFGGAFSPDDRLLAVCLETGHVEIRTLPALQVVHRLRTDSMTLYSVLFSPDGTRLYCGGANGTVQVYATDDWRLITALRSPSSPEYRDTTILALGMNARGTVLAGYRADGTVRIWNSAPVN